MNREQRELWFSEHTSVELDTINWWLAQHARDEQIPPLGDWFVWFIRSGRGYGKTRTGAETVIHWVEQGYKRIALVGQSKADVRDTMVEVGESSLLGIAAMHKNIRIEYKPSLRRVVFPDHGAIAIIYSGDEPGQLRGPQHEKAWVDELAKFKYPDEAWSNLTFGLRIGRAPQILVTSTPRPIKLIRELIVKPTTIDVRCSTDDNIANLSPVFIREVIDPVRGTRIGRQEVSGEILDDNPNALWKRAWIDDARVNALPDLVRIVVAVDPSGSAGGDEVGITVQGSALIDNVWHFYLLDDVSLHGTPKQWGDAVVSAYNKWHADAVIAEGNFGGDMVTNTIQTVSGGRNVKVKLVHASRGKAIRAEPVSTAYEQGRGHHVGSFPILEDELVEWEPGMKSPNRLDALVWGATELILHKRGVFVG